MNFLFYEYNVIIILVLLNILREKVGIPCSIVYEIRDILKLLEYFNF